MKKQIWDLNLDLVLQFEVYNLLFNHRNYSVPYVRLDHESKLGYLRAGKFLIFIRFNRLTI